MKCNKNDFDKDILNFFEDKKIKKPKFDINDFIMKETGQEALIYYDPLKDIIDKNPDAVKIFDKWRSPNIKTNFNYWDMPGRID